MREIFGFIFDRLTDPLELPIHAFGEYIILLVISAIAYAIAFSAVGEMYNDGSIDSSAEGRVIHWLIRLAAFVVIWAITYVVIALVKWIVAHWIVVVSVLGGLLITGIITFFVIFNKKEMHNERIKR